MAMLPDISLSKLNQETIKKLDLHQACVFSMVPHTSAPVEEGNFSLITPTTTSCTYVKEEASSEGQLHLNSMLTNHPQPSFTNIKEEPHLSGKYSKKCDPSRPIQTIASVKQEGQSGPECTQNTDIVTKIPKRDHSAHILTPIEKNPVPCGKDNVTSHTQETCLCIKEESLLDEKETPNDVDCFSVIVKEEEDLCQEEIISVYIKKEPCSHGEGFIADYDTSSSAYCIKEEPLNREISISTCHRSTTSEDDSLSDEEHLPDSRKKYPIHSDSDSSTSADCQTAGIKVKVLSCDDEDLTDEELNTLPNQVGEKPFLCSHCGESFQNGPDLVSHMRQHPEDKPYSCSECGKGFVSNANLVVHRRIHTGERPFSCPDCGRCFRAKSNFNRHRRGHAGKKPYCCSECGEAFEGHVDLVKHQKQHVAEKPYCCLECLKCFLGASNFATHRLSHSEEKPYSCSKCGLRFSLRAECNKHQKIHKKTPYCCFECGKSFTVLYHLQNHQKLHTGKNICFCVECGECFTSNSRLNVHQRIHTGEKPFSCSECGKCFVSCSSRNRHQRSHSGQRPFPCDECSRCFNNSSDLVAHQRTHTGEKPFKCDECGRYFSTEMAVVRHQRVHTGEKPYGCPDCDKRFQGTSSLAVHQKRHHAEKVPN